MVHQERLAVGEKWFVFATLLVLGVEGVLAIVTNAMHTTVPGLILGVGGFVFVMFLGNRLYSGDRRIYGLALAWVAFQLLYVLIALGLIVSSEQGVALARSLGAPVTWAVLVKGAAYAILGAVLWSMPSVQDFFAGQRGELTVTHEVAVAPSVPAAEAPPVPITFTADLNEGIQNLASAMKTAAWLLIVLGAAQLLIGGLKNEMSSLGMWLAVAEGALLIALGLLLAGPANRADTLTDKEGQTSTELNGFLQGLSCHFKSQAAVVVLLLVVWITRWLV